MITFFYWWHLSSVLVVVFVAEGIVGEKMLNLFANFVKVRRCKMREPMEVHLLVLMVLNSLRSLYL